MVVILSSVLSLRLHAAEELVTVVTNVNVTSNHVADVSSLQAWKKSTLKPGMTDQEKAIAIWKTVVSFEHEMAAPAEFTQFGNAVADAIKTFNVYGYNLCGPGASHVVELARYAGMKARGWNINGHTVAEIFYDDAWHMFDASYINYFPKDNGVVASVAEIMAEVKAWHEKNPGFKGDVEKLKAFRREDNFTAWKTKGPALLARCPTYSERGVLPAGLMDWHQTMRQYDGSVSFEYEVGYSMGYQVNIALRPGEKLLRNFSHHGLHVNMQWERDARWLQIKSGEGPFAYSKNYGDSAPGRVGNGGIEYDVPLSDAALEKSALRYENLQPRAKGEKGPALALKDPEKVGVLEIRMQSPYVFLGGVAGLKAALPIGADIKVEFSDNNGREYYEREQKTKTEDVLDLSRMIHRRYEYRLRFTLKGKGAGLESLKFLNSIQHSQRALPVITSGENTIRFSAGTGEQTVTVEPALKAESKVMQLTYEDFGAKLDGMAEREGGGLGVVKDKGTVTFPIETPADMKRLRVFTYYRARDAKDGFLVEVSFDGGKTWRKAGVCEGERNFGSALLTVEDIPEKTKAALVRWSGTQTNAAMIFNLRIDADYKPAGSGFRPVKITYVWDEAGVEKKDVHVARKAEDVYTIKCGEKVTPRSIMLELNEGGRELLE
jgi:hypothetical protein